MKTKLVFTLLIITTIFYAQTKTDTLTISSDYALSKKKPLLVNKNTVIINTIDSLYLVNNIRLSYYEKLRTIVNSNIDKDIEQMILQYESQLNDNNQLFNQLEKKCKSQSQLYEQTISELKISLEKANTDLKRSQEALTNADSAIDTGLTEISKSKRKRFWKTLGLFGGGATIGLLTGFVLAK